MLRRLSTVLLLIIAITLVFNIGCSSGNSSNNIAYISPNGNSEYEKTFEELHLGIIFDYNLKLPAADTSWVEIWVEGYSDGKATEPFIISSLSYGLSPKQVEEGKMGFGIINPNSDDAKFFLYSGGIRTQPHSIDNNIFIDNGINKWDYAIGSKSIGLKSGEEMLLAVYRQGEGSIRGAYDYQNKDSVKEMINEHITVLLLKIKVEKNEM